MSDKTIKLGEITNDGRMLSPMDSLKSAIQDIENGEIEPNKILILSLNSKNQYAINFYQSGMTMSECISLCEVAKSLFLKEMDY